MANAKRDEREQRQRALARRRALVVGGNRRCASSLQSGGSWPCGARRSSRSRRSTVSGNRRLTDGRQSSREPRFPDDATLLRLQQARDQSIGFCRSLDRRGATRPPVPAYARHRDRRARRQWRRSMPAARKSGSSTARASGSRSARPRTPPTLPVVRDIEKLAPQAGARSDSPELLNALAVLGGLSPELRSRRSARFRHRASTGRRWFSLEACR